MLTYSGQISKLISYFKNPIQYSLPIGDEHIKLNQFINKNIKIDFNGEIKCIECNKKIKKTFMQGFCYPCFISSPKTSECILKPELCKAHEGQDRDMEWSEKHCLQDQYVYLSLTSNLKVGVTRNSQIPTRWIDQGAHAAILFAKTPNRYLAGMIEKDINQYISDRTYWRRMLLGEYPKLNLLDEKEKLSTKLNQQYYKYIDNDNTITKIEYPQFNNIEKIKSLNIEKNPTIEGTLTGIKGQYLFINNNTVLNIRKYTGYIINIKF